MNDFRREKTGPPVPSIIIDAFYERELHHDVCNKLLNETSTVEEVERWAIDWMAGEQRRLKLAARREKLFMEYNEDSSFDMAAQFLRKWDKITDSDKIVFANYIAGIVADQGPDALRNIAGILEYRANGIDGNLRHAKALRLFDAALRSGCLIDKETLFTEFKALPGHCEEKAKTFHTLLKDVGLSGLPGKLKYPSC